jgi:uncharacterized protein (TIGR00296 family)
MALTLEQGRDLVAYARAVIAGHFRNMKPEVPDSLREVFAEKRGVFVTLSNHPGHDLRGCIGFPEPTHPLGMAVEHSALSAAFEDPRFPPLNEGELENITVEVSVLTDPRPVEVDHPSQYVEKICVGRDGLIAEQGWARGLLLPQVPVEWNWDAETFLCHVCTKAGLPPTAWLDKGFTLYSFKSENIFTEKEPLGEVVEKKLMDDSDSNP